MVSHFSSVCITPLQIQEIFDCSIAKLKKFSSPLPKNTPDFQWMTISVYECHIETGISKWFSVHALFNHNISQNAHTHIL